MNAPPVPITSAPTHSDLSARGFGYPPPLLAFLHCCEALVMRGTLSFFNDGTPYEESTDAEDTRGLTASMRAVKFDEELLPV